MMDHGKEIVALAAKAAGIELACWDEVYHLWYRMTDDPEKVRQTGNGYGSAVFDPLGDDGDALRLAVAVPNLDIKWIIAEAWQANETHADRCAHVRRAIVRAAGHMGNML